MKKITWIISFMLIATCAWPQDPPHNNAPKSVPEVKYCAKMKNNEIVVMQKNSELMVDVRLANGTVIKTDGTIIKSDGTQVKLKNGECADDHGNVILQKNPDKMTPVK